MWKSSKQYKNIDILLKINNFSIIIEDKTGTQSHGDQLTRYRNIIASEVGEENVLAIFFKTHDQSNYKKEIDDGFKIFSRDKLISVLNIYENVLSDIFNDFKDYINEQSLTKTTAWAEPALVSDALDVRFQFLRKGYFYQDITSTKEALVFNRTVTLKDAWAKEQKK